ncbi:MAG: response regulator [Chitinivibrionales bacterium]|nr:response regulator [Chitinivibrionales bacterium]
MEENNIVEQHELLDRIPIGVIICSLEGAILYANAFSRQCLGYSVDELDATIVDGLIVENENQMAWQAIRTVVLKDQTVFDGEVTLIRKNNDSVTCAMTVFGILPTSRHDQQFVLVFQDISHQKSITMELEKKNLEMAKMNSELIRSNQELKRVSELKTKFLSIASHELKTPLTSIKGYSEIIIDNMKDKVDAAVYRMIESVNRAADRLNNVINNMLDVTRIEQKRLRLKPENCNVKDIISECIDDFTQFTSRRNIPIRVSIDPDLPQFYGDRTRMHQVFTNLFSNALKYSPDFSEIELRVFLENVQEEQFHIIVSDHGIGIDKDELDKVFRPFYEIADTVRHSTDPVKFLGGGTGLGLSIVKGIIERHGGAIWAESVGTQHGKFPGSQFHIVLPVRPHIQWDDNETMLSKIHKTTDVEQEIRPIGGSQNVKPLLLIIDDDREAIEITRMVLQTQCDIITADSGEEGLRVAFLQKPSLILLDLYLPGLDGTQICRILRSQEETKHIPISFFTAANQYDEIERCYASGADDFILKPFSGKEILTKVTQLMNRRTYQSSQR